MGRAEHEASATYCFAPGPLLVIDPSHPEGCPARLAAIGHACKSGAAVMRAVCAVAVVGQRGRRAFLHRWAILRQRRLIVQMEREPLPFTGCKLKTVAVGGASRYQSFAERQQNRLVLQGEALSYVQRRLNALG